MQTGYMKILVKNHKKLEYLRETIIVLGFLVLIYLFICPVTNMYLGPQDLSNLFLIKHETINLYFKLTFVLYGNTLFYSFHIF